MTFPNGCYPDARIDTPPADELVEEPAAFDVDAFVADIPSEPPTLPRVGDAGDRGRRT